MNIYESAEDYLEQILMLLEQKGHARSVDIAAGLNVSKPSVSIAMKKLRENGYIHMGSDNLISLTDKGYAIARKIYDRHLSSVGSMILPIRPGLPNPPYPAVYSSERIIGSKTGEVKEPCLYSFSLL